jgi:hypothetical protein
VTEANECQATAQTTVTVHQPESFDVSISPSQVCDGGNITASVMNAGSFQNIQWEAYGGSIVSGQGTASVVVAPAMGSNSVSLRINANEKSSGCDAYQLLAPIAVSAAPLSAHISTVTAMCAQTTQTASLPDAGSGATYAWTIANGSIVNGEGTRTITYTADGSGDVMLTVAVANGNCHGSDSADVVSTNAPAITNEPQDTTVPPGQPATLSVTATGDGIQYFWYQGTSGERTKLVSSQSTGTFTTPRLEQTTSYWVDVTNTCGAVASRTVTVTAGGRHRVSRH